MQLYEKKNKETSKEYAYRVLRDNIMSLELKPGDLLSEADLAEKLNISRTPIREVLMKLKNEYLIEVKPQSGTYVSQIDKNLIEEAIFMRTVLEKEVIKLVCEFMPEEILMELEKNIFAQKLIASKECKDLDFHILDTKFHKLLFVACNKVNVWEKIMGISTHYNRMRLLAEMNIDKNKIIEQHEQLLDIIKNNHIEKVDRYVEEHILKPTKEWSVE